jgi:DNA/RNA endonuclease YhcR with UshA esterase domain
MKRIITRYEGKCIVCGKKIPEGETVYWEPGRGIWHLSCEPDRRPHERGKYLKISIVIIIILIAILGFLVASPNLMVPRAIVTTETVTQTQTFTITEIVTAKPTIAESTAMPQGTVSAGKWISSDENVISYLDAGKHVGQRKTVEGTIVRTYKSSAAIFLNFHDPYQGYFYIVIFKDDWGNFPFKPEEYYRGKEVRVTGIIKMYKGSPEIIVDSPSQIEVAYKGFNYP